MIKTIVNSLKEIGNNTSFVCLYNLLSSKKYEALVSDIETALITLLPVSMNEIKMIIAEDKYSKSTDLISLIFDKKSEILQNSYENSKYVSGVAQPFRETDETNRNIYEKEWFELTEVPFEDRMFFVPKGFDKILTMGYGDYMTPLPEDQRQTHHTYDTYKVE